ncbi:MAG: bacteriohopanetetrol glucosamine biosynthesis glycosyltransferase HpnI [Terracidiphilus sp.]|nr:bacteriohopanetetrol glucosamine biosynthesis glycosyltransferase HpnI [Terracidiphilus sp.]
MTPHAIAFGIEALTTLLAVAGMAYFLAAMFAAQIYLRERRRKHAEFAPGVSILKSLKGLDPAMLEAFRSHCQQNYAGKYELLFGVADAADPAVPAVEQLQREFPDHAIRLLVCPERLGSNGKVSTLMQMEAEAQYNYLLVNDSDITVSTHYLERVMACFAPKEGGKPVGLVTALYRGRAHGTLGSRCESLGIATDFQAGVLLSKMIEGGLHYGLGSTLAVDRKALEAAGGLKGLVDQLADDYEMGARVDKAGYRVALCTDVVETSVPAYRWHEFTDHQLRWLRTVRDARPGGYFGMIFMQGFALALVNAIASGLSPLSLWLLAVSFLLRISMATMVGACVLGDAQVIESLWLLPVRDAVQMGLWVTGFVGNTIVWRGERFELKDGKLIGKK